jgi:hypothetical protein
MRDRQAAAREPQGRKKKVSALRNVMDIDLKLSITHEWQAVKLLFSECPQR